MFKTKKIITMLLCVVLSFGMLGCFKKDNNSGPSVDDPLTAIDWTDQKSKFETNGFTVTISDNNIDEETGFSVLEAVRDDDWGYIVQYRRQKFASENESAWKADVAVNYGSRNYTADRRGRFLRFYTDGAVSALEVIKEKYLTIKMWGGGTQWSGSYLDIMKDFVDDWNKGLLGDENVYLNTKIEFVSEAEIEANLTYAVGDAKNCPQLVIWDRFVTPTYANSGQLAKIDQYVDLYGINPDDYTDAAISEMKYKDSYYGLPIDVDTWGVYINITRIKAHNASVGVDSPSYVNLDRLNNQWTWYDFMDIAQSLAGKVNGVDHYGATADDMQEHLFKYLVSTGKDFFVKDGNGDFETIEKMVAGQNRKIPKLYNGTEMDDILNFFHKVGNSTSKRDSTKIARANVEPAHFYNGTVPLYTAATYFDGQIRKYETNSGKWIDSNEYKFLPQPRYSELDSSTAKAGGVNGGMTGGFSLVIPNVSGTWSSDQIEKAQRAAAIMKWWSSGEGAVEWSKRVGTLPAVKALYSNETFMNSMSPTIRTASEFVQYYQPRPSVIGFQSYQVQVINTNVQDFIKNKGNTQANRSTLLTSLISGVESYVFI